MPAFANFARRYIGDSELYKTLASLLERRKPRDPKDEWSFDSLEQRDSTKKSLRTTFGGTKPPAPRAVAVNRKEPDVDDMETELDDATEVGFRNGYDTSIQVNVSATGHETKLESGIMNIRVLDSITSVKAM